MHVYDFLCWKLSALPQCVANKQTNKKLPYNKNCFKGIDKKLGSLLKTALTGLKGHVSNKNMHRERNFHGSFTYISGEIDSFCTFCVVYHLLFLPFFCGLYFSLCVCQWIIHLPVPWNLKTAVRIGNWSYCFTLVWTFTINLWTEAKGFECCISFLGVFIKYHALRII